MKPEYRGRMRVLDLGIAESAEVLEFQDYRLANIRSRKAGRTERQVRANSVPSIQAEKERRIAIYAAMAERGERLFG